MIIEHKKYVTTLSKQTIMPCTYVDIVCSCIQKHMYLDLKHQQACLACLACLASLFNQFHYTYRKIASINARY